MPRFWKSSAKCSAARCGIPCRNWRRAELRNRIDYRYRILAKPLGRRGKHPLVKLIVHSYTAIRFNAHAKHRLQFRQEPVTAGVESMQRAISVGWIEASLYDLLQNGSRSLQ